MQYTAIHDLRATLVPSLVEYNRIYDSASFSLNQINIPRAIYPGAGYIVSALFYIMQKLSATNTHIGLTYLAPEPSGSV